MEVAAEQSRPGPGSGVGPLQVVQKVEEGVPVGLGAGLEDGYHGAEAGFHLLDVCSGEQTHPELRERLRASGAQRLWARL